MERFIISRLVGDRANHQHSTDVCPYCLYCFSKEKLLRSHILECSIYPPQHLEYPSPKHDGDTDYNISKFKHFVKTLPVPMVLYCHFVAILVPVEDNGTTSKTVTKEIHKPSGFSCLRVAKDSTYTRDISTYSGPDVMDVFFNHFKEQEEFVFDVLSKIMKMNPLTEEDQKDPHATKELQTLW